MLQAAAQQQASASFYALNGTSLQPLATAYTSPADPHKVRRAARLPHAFTPPPPARASSPAPTAAATRARVA
jgi:hypothetical protein